MASILTTTRLLTLAEMACERLCLSHRECQAGSVRKGLDRNPQGYSAASKSFSWSITE